MDSGIYVRSGCITVWVVFLASVARIDAFVGWTLCRELGSMRTPFRRVSGVILDWISSQYWSSSRSNSMLGQTLLVDQADRQFLHSHTFLTSSIPFLPRNNFL